MTVRGSQCRRFPPHPLCALSASSACSNRHRQATDPRDKIYAILGLAQSKRAQVRVDPDYSEPVKDVYRKLHRVLEELYEDLGFQNGI
jgi:hypothetical protein